ncbi:MAG: hypothetical protein Kow0029_08220 [Candidatus Rifleibacteriota bacterium]
MKRRGFAYLVAVLILGLLAFMGIFLMQSSSEEYSQAAISVYRTMARQLAEAAAEEAFVMLEERFKDKTETGFFQQLLWQASTAKTPKNGGATGLNPTLLHDFTDLKDKVTQALTLQDYHMTRAGFEIEKVLPSIKDLRPIDQGPLNDDKNYYRSPDRPTGFDNQYSKDWYLTLQIDVTVALQKRRKLKIDYTISRDVKILNLGPIARNFTLFSILSHRIPSADPATIQNVIRTEMNAPDTPGGRLILWNQPFQSRVYLHGPSIIALENPELARDRPGYGAYNLYDPTNSIPGPNNAFQYSDTFFGFSYYPTLGRAIFPPRGTLHALGLLFGLSEPKPDKGDSADLASNYPNLGAHSTVKGGFLPSRDISFWEKLKTIDANGIQDTYFRGTNVNQKFLPGGPFCRTPWKYVSPLFDGEDRYLPNSTADYSGAVRKEFPKDDEYLRLEHRWVKDNPDIAKASQIYARTYKIKLNNVTNSIQTPPSEELLEFSMSYYNDPEPETLLGKIGGVFSSLGEKLWNRICLPFEAVGVLASPLITSIFGNGEDSYISASTEQNFENLFPENFKYNMRGIATRKMKDQDDIPRDPEGRWILNGVYWLDSFQVDMPVTYVGTGTIVVTKFDPAKPMRIRGSIVCLKAEDKCTPLGHLNLIYHPYKSDVTDTTERMLSIEGSGHTIEASVYSCYGIKTNDGNIPNPTAIGMDPSQTLAQWKANGFFTKLFGVTNIIMGNYVNFYMNKHQQRGDLWVIHNVNSPMYFDQPSPNNYEIVQTRIDASEDGRKAYELMTHEFFMSPKIQHVATIGGSD